MPQVAGQDGQTVGGPLLLRLPTQEHAGRERVPIMPLPA